MKFSLVLRYVTLTSAIALPNQEHFEDQIALASDTEPDFVDYVSSSVESLKRVHGDQAEKFVKDLHKGYKQCAHQAYESVDEALSSATSAADASVQDLAENYFDAKAWAESKLPELPTLDDLGLFKITESSNDRPRHGHGKSNHTVYQLIANSKYTTELAKLISEYPDLVKTLNKTDAHITVFAPTDHAFAKIPKHAPKPSKEFLEKLLLYHVSPEFYPARRVLAGRTIPTLLKTDSLTKDKAPQRLATEVSFKGLTVNFYSKIVAINIFGSNGVIHGVDSILLPPPPAVNLIGFIPEDFSTLELGLIKTGLFKILNETEHYGGTLFAPSNFAFRKLGPRANAFLFSPPGLKYLKALLEFHIVPDQVLYSDHYLDARDSAEEAIATDRPRHGPPRGYKHFDLLTLLDEKSLAVDVSRYGRLIDLRINGYTHVTVPDVIARDGVIHEVSDVLIPPHHHSTADASAWDGESEIGVEDLVQRLEPYVHGASEPTEL